MINRQAPFINHKDQYSPQLPQKAQMNPRSFLTPNLISKDINMLQSHNAYLKSKY